MHRHYIQHNPLTWVWSRHLGLQLLDLFHQQRDVLQQVFVLQQQLMDSSLGLQPSRGLRAQLVLQQVHLTGGREADGRYMNRSLQILLRCENTQVQRRSAAPEGRDQTVPPWTPESVKHCHCLILPAVDITHIYLYLSSVSTQLFISLYYYLTDIPIYLI